jgi:hypothetical protein
MAVRHGRSTWSLGVRVQRRSLVALLIVSATASAANPAPSSLVDTLSKQLHYARSPSHGARLKMRCPKTLQPLIGMSEATLRSALGEPDYELVLPNLLAPEHLRWLYFFRAEDVRDSGVISLGRFPPGLEFYFDAELRVTHAACSLAK